MAKFTINDFRKQYATDEACLDKIFTLRYGKLEACPECQCVASFRRITTRRCYQCTECYTQYYPTAGTVFEKTRTPLSDWFYVIYLFTTTRNGVAAKEIQRQLGVTYKCAFRMGHCIRTLIAGMTQEQLQGFVECDEVRIGGKNKNRHKSKQFTKEEAWAGKDKVIVFGAIQRGGQVRTKIIEDTFTTTLMDALKEHVVEGSIVITEELQAYRRIEGTYFHGKVNHGAGEYARGLIHTNSIEGYWSHVKRMISGTHISVSKKYLQNYLDENSFRYNNRENQGGMFEAIINHLPVVTE